MTWSFIFYLITLSQLHPLCNIANIHCHEGSVFLRNFGSLLFTRLLQGTNAIFDIYEHSSLLEYDAVPIGFYRRREAACCLHVQCPRTIT
jgi:hypothetical protein